MFAAIARTQDGVIIASWHDDAVTDVADLPTAPDDCFWIEMAEKDYDLVRQGVFLPFTAGRPSLRIVQDGARYTITGNPSPTEEPYFAIVRTSDDAVIALDRVQGPLARGLEHRAIAKADWGAINARSALDGAVPAWTCAADGSVSPRADEREVLRVSRGRGAIEFALVDGAGKAIDYSGSRTVLVYRDGVPRPVELAFVGGAASVRRALEPGRYQFASAEPETCRVEGDTEVVVAEPWS